MSITKNHPTGAGHEEQQRKRCGFSLIELLISMAILLLVTGVVFDQIIAMQRKAAAEGMKVDSTQQAREFIDQMIRDLHLAGYPKASMNSVLADDPNANASPQVAAGLVSISPTLIILEGDVNSEGVVYSVNVSYVPNDANDPNCPCIRRRAIPKIAAAPLLQPVSPYYSEVQHVMAPGVGAGRAGEDLFTFFDQNGNQLDVTGAPNVGPNGDPNGVLAAVRTVKINLSLLPAQTAAGNIENMRTSLTGTAKLEL